jgi:F0F1-type ATP synthase assembly protein I
MAYSKAQSPTRIWTLTFLSIPFNKFLNKLVVFYGGDKLKVILTMRYIFIAKGHSTYKCCIVSFFVTKQHILFLYQFLFAKLSFVTMKEAYKSYLSGASRVHIFH